MSDNLRIWEALYKTDPKHTKPFTRAGGFKGTATRPIWLTKRLTEHFGPAGIGWGMEKPDFQTVSAGDEILVFCTVALWYVEGAKRGLVYGVGGDKVLAKRQSGGFTNDEAFKASYTDALSNAMKQIGVSADIHMGMFEDDKYVREVTEEFSDAHKPGPAGSASGGTDFRPPGPRRTGWVAEAERDGTLDPTRTKGKLPSNSPGVQINTPTAAGNAVKRIAWVKESISFLRAPTTNEHVARDWWVENKTRVDIIETAIPTEYERLLDAYNQALERKVVA